VTWAGPVAWTDPVAWVVAALLALATALWPGPRSGVPRVPPQPGAMGSQGAGRPRVTATVREWWAGRPGAQERARAAHVAQTCETLDLCVAGLRAGLDLEAVLEFAAGEAGAGVGAVDLLGVHPGSPLTGVVGQAHDLSTSAGVPLADAWAAAAAVLREHEALRRKVAVALAGPRATMRVLTLLPLAGPLVGLVFGIDPWHLYVGSPLAITCMVLGLGLMFLGRWWCTRLVSRLGLGEVA